MSIQFMGVHVLLISSCQFNLWVSMSCCVKHQGPEIPPFSTEKAPTIPFHELELDQQIEQSSVIAIARYEPGNNGEVKAIITEILKKDPNTTFYYNIGDEYKSSSYYPRDNTRYGDGVVIFFTGSPANMRMSMSYHGDRIRSLGDLPIELLRKKCKEKNT